MKVYSSRIQSAFSKIFITRDYPKLIHGVRSGIYLYWVWLFLCFYQAWRKGQCLIALQAENFFGQVIFKSEVCKSFVTLFYCMTTSPLPSSLWYLQWRVQLSPGMFKCYKLTFYLHFMYCSWRRYSIYYIFYLNVAWEPSSRDPGEVEHQGTLFAMLYLKKSEF